MKIQEEYSSEQYTWDFLKGGGFIQVNEQSKSASAILVYPTENAEKAALVLGKHIIEESVNIDVGIWRDENVFVFFVTSKEEARSLFTTNVIKDQPRVLAVKIVSGRMCTVYTRSTIQEEVKETHWKADDTMTSLSKMISMSEKTLSGSHVRISYMPQPVHVNEDREDNVLERLWGYEISIIEAMSEKSGFTLAYHRPNDGEWGNIKKDGNQSYWSGIVGEVVYNRADIGMSAITIQQSRCKVVTPSVGYGTEGIQMFAPGPLPLPHFFALTRGFDFTSWIFIISVCILFPFVAFILLYPISKYNFQTTVLYTITVLFKACFTFYNLKGLRYGQISLLGVYLLLGTWLMASNIITMFYTCNLSAHLITPGYSKPIQDLEEAVSSNFPIKMYGIGAGIENEWRTSTDPEIRQFSSERKVLKFSQNYEVLDEVGSGRSIFVDWFTNRAIFDLRFPSSGKKKLIHLVDTGTKMSPKYTLGWQIRKRFRGKVAVSLMMSRLLEGGLVDKMFEDTFSKMYSELDLEEKKKILERRKERGLKPWSMKELEAPFLCLALMIGGSILALGGEIVHRKLYP